MPGQAAKARRLWGRLVQPHPSLSGAAARKARLTASYLLVLLGLACLGLLSFSSGDFASPSFLASVGAVAAVLASYVLARSRWPDVGGVLASAAMVAAICVVRVSEIDTDTGASAYYFLAIPLLTASLLLGPAWVLLVAGLCVGAGALTESLLAIPMDEETQTTLLVYFATVTGLGLLFSFVNRQDLRALERREEDLVAANRKLEGAHAERTRMLQQVAHDMATPLTPIKLQSHVLNGSTDARIQHARDVLHRNIAQLERLVQDVGDLARLQGAGLRLQQAPVDLSALARQAVESLRPQAAEREVDLTIEADAAIPVVGDDVRLTQVLYNLVGNALKFTPPNGQVAVRVRRSNGQAEVAVCDNGHGMEPGHLVRLFAPFVQVHAPSVVTRREDKGSGLGLYISKGIVEAHGGAVTAASEGRGRGATFTFSLPLAETA